MTQKGPLLAQAQADAPPTADLRKDRSLPPESDPAAPGFRRARYPFFLMAHALGHYGRRMESELRRIGADQPHWRILAILGEDGAAPVSRIADLAVYKLSTVTRIIQRMVAAGLVTTRRSERDGRVTEVMLTKAGEARLEQVRAVGSAIANEAFAGFSRREIETLIDLLTRLDTKLSGD